MNIDGYLKVPIKNLANQYSSFRENNGKLLFHNIYSLDFTAEEVFLKNLNGSFVFLVKDGVFDFHRVYFATVNLESLSDALLLLEEIRGDYVVDFITANDSNGNLLDILNHSNFVKYVKLKKMSLISNQTVFRSSENVKLSESKYIDEIYNILVKKFDPFADRIPSRDQVALAIVNRTIFLAFKGECIVGFLWFDVKKVVSELRYLYVDINFRNHGLATALMSAYSKETAFVIKKQLWVSAGNFAAITLYEKIGYKFDCLLDNIFIRKGIL
jgi:GNAT superfamily N-acetyltransferase